MNTFLSGIISNSMNQKALAVKEIFYKCSYFYKNDSMICNSNVNKNKEITETLFIQRKARDLQKNPTNK